MLLEKQVTKKKNGQKDKAPKAPPASIDLTRETVLELRYLNEAGRRIQLEMARLNDDNDKVTTETAALRAKLQKDNDGIDVLGQYAIDFDNQKANLRQQQPQAPAPTPAIVEADVKDEDISEPVANA